MIVAAAGNAKILWYLTRGLGVGALLLLTASVALGVLTASRWRSPRWPRFATAGLHRNLTLLAICFLLSGATGLIYEVVWARMLGLVFGATTIAISAVLVAFMGGLALGSALAARLAVRISRPLRGYALMEICIGLYALIVPTLFRLADSAYAAVWQSFRPGFYGFAFLRFVLKHVWLRPKRLRAAFAFARFIRDAHIARFLLKTKIAREFSPQFEFALALLEGSKGYGAARGSSQVTAINATNVEGCRAWIVIPRSG